MKITTTNRGGKV